MRLMQRKETARNPAATQGRIRGGDRDARDAAAFAALVDGAVDGREVTGAAMAVWRARDGLALSHGAGALTSDMPYYGASTTKLYITALLIQLRQEGRVDFEAPIGTWLPERQIAGLNVQDGTDMSQQITLRMLMRQTSGIADHFQHERGGVPLEKRLMQGDVAPFSPDEALDWAREMGAHYPPGTGNKAVYSDTNYQLQGLIIEAIEGRPIAESMRERLFEPLDLTQTWLHSDPDDHRAILPRYLDQPVDIRRAATSFGADGGLITTATEGLTFLRAFFDGRLFETDQLAALYDWRKMFFPLTYGTGIERMKLPRIMTGLRASPELIGKAGLTGAFVFADLQAGIFMAGSVNQIHKPGRAFRLMLKTVNLLR